MKSMKENLRQAVEDGDGMAEAMLGDMQEDEGLPRVEPLKPGDWLVIFTGAFFHCGQLVQEDHEYYVLAPGSAQIHETGDFEAFYGQGICTYCETIPGWCRVRKGVITHVTSWPFDRPCRRA